MTKKTPRLYRRKKVTMTVNAIALKQQYAIDVLPDTDRYKCRFKIRSRSSNKMYLVSYDAASGAGYWTCSCPGNIIHGQCTHLTEMGLQGRKYGKNQLTKSQVEALGGHR